MTFEGLRYTMCFISLQRIIRRISWSPRIPTCRALVSYALTIQSSTVAVVTAHR
nr:MAG TPA: hypothetical protein [Bacteriophage sp.]